MEENVDYKLIPAMTGSEQNEVWNVEFLTGEFSGTIVEYNTIKINTKDEELRFNFNIIFDPFEGTLDPNTNFPLQKHAADVLYSIIESAIEDGTAVIGDKNEQHRADDTQEHHH